MPIVGGLDIHRKQMTFDYVDTDTGEIQRGQIAPADRSHVADWLARRFGGRADVDFALEGCTGWRYVAEELAACRDRRARRRAGRHGRAAGPQAARQDRPNRLPAPTPGAGRRPAARVLDPAGPHPGVPGAARALP